VVGTGTVEVVDISKVDTDMDSLDTIEAVVWVGGSCRNRKTSTARLDDMSDDVQIE
jgi:hypothetical protein